MQHGHYISKNSGHSIYLTLKNLKQMTIKEFNMIQQ